MIIPIVMSIIAPPIIYSNTLNKIAEVNRKAMAKIPKPMPVISKQLNISQWKGV